jgi:hypothetical protein
MVLERKMREKGGDVARNKKNVIREHKNEGRPTRASHTPQIALDT